MDKTMTAKPLLEQILDEMFNNVKNKEEFNDRIIGELIDLAAQDGLSNSEKIIDILTNKENV